MLNKRAQSSGIAWFVATIIIFLILGVFYALMIAVSLTKTKVSSEISANGFYDIQDIRAMEHFLDYGGGEIKNPIPYFVYSNKNTELKELFFSYVKKVYEIDQNNLKGKNFCMGLRKLTPSSLVVPKDFYNIIGIQQDKYITFRDIQSAKDSPSESPKDIAMIYPRTGVFYLINSQGEYGLFGISAGGGCNVPK